MLGVEPSTRWEVRPLHHLADCVEPQGLVQCALNRLLREERIGLSL
jgi:hypothetical protein